MIRRAVAGDAAALATLNAEVQALHVGWQPARYRLPEPGAVLAAFEGFLAREDVVIGIAEGPGAAEDRPPSGASAGPLARLAGQGWREAELGGWASASGRAGDGDLGYAVGIVTTKESPFTYPVTTMSLDQIGVSASARGRGVGRALMAWFEDEARARGCSRLQLDVLAVNEGARGFYARLGYAPEQLRYAKLVPGGGSG